MSFSYFVDKFQVNMQCVVLVVFALVVVASSKPQFVEWFEIKPADIVPRISKNLPTPSFKAKTSFKSYIEEWEFFKGNNSKKYDGQEENARFAIFRQNLDYIKKHNEKFNNGLKSYSLGINQFADMKPEEFRMYNGLWRDYNRSHDAQCSTHLIPEFLTVPDEVDWRTRGYVTPVKNQGQCGSCWSFSTTGSLEGQHFRKAGKLLSLSEQQLVDCSGNFGNEGCNGGLMDQAFKYIVKAGGIESESEYAYKAKKEKCHFLKEEVVATASGCVDVKSGSEDDLKNACGQVGPISVAIDASHQSFQLYQQGVYDEPDCSSTELDHGVLVVGYGTENGQDYWLVKNSWGTMWGEDGYVKMTRNKDNQCGIATQASYPLV